MTGRRTLARFDLLLAQDDRHPDILGRFLDQNPNSRISWLHYLHTGELSKAAGALKEEAPHEKRVAGRKVRLGSF